ncbi:hypothetical protein SAMD00023353_6400240 [Rosellinia necatrix]|uniref:Uncharacterized protein n=1 Tax=Rosellinia necatrix TaxID=77044 RepID=A0A1S8AAT1_ROSNE|nr:hypothetical protein SAMD00023353_6400240 [Rosellinia necatrix]
MLEEGGVPGIVWRSSLSLPRSGTRDCRPSPMVADQPGVPGRTCAPQTLYCTEAEDIH